MNRTLETGYFNPEWLDAQPIETLRQVAREQSVKDWQWASRVKLCLILKQLRDERTWLMPIM